MLRRPGADVALRLLQGRRGVADAVRADSRRQVDAHLHREDRRGHSAAGQEALPIRQQSRGTIFNYVANCDTFDDLYS